MGRRGGKGRRIALRLFHTAVLTSSLFLAGCKKPQASKEPAQPAPSTGQPYVVLESHASKYVLRQPISESSPEPSTYVIKHGNVIINAHCGVLARWSGGYDKCTDFPEPVVPVGEPLTMHRDSYGLCWPANKDKGTDGVCFVIESEKVQE